MRLINADEIKYHSNGCFRPLCGDTTCNECMYGIAQKKDIDSIPELNEWRSIEKSSPRDGELILVKTNSDEIPVCGKFCSDPKGLITIESIKAFLPLEDHILAWRYV